MLIILYNLLIFHHEVRIRNLELHLLCINLVDLYLNRLTFIFIALFSYYIYLYIYSICICIWIICLFFMKLYIYFRNRKLYIFYGMYRMEYI